MGSLTLASLFDGSGGFPLGGLICGITPVWSAEVEPFPIRVTTKRLPQVKHYGDVCKIKGFDVPPVDCITFGSPCQSFSVAGKREGMEGKSGLFYEAVRIIREMRKATGGRSPRFAVMENVPGIYSSVTNGKSDFLEVLNELVKTKDTALSIPMPSSGKWNPSGEVVGDGFSLGWRTFDAQFWGVPQRRRRCYIVLDLDGECAGEILFNETRLRGNPPQGGCTKEGVAGTIAAGTGIPIPVLNDCQPGSGQGGSLMDVSDDVTGTLRAQVHGHQPIVFEPGALSRLGKGGWADKAGCLRADPGDNQLAVAIPINTQAGLRNHKDVDSTGLGVGDVGDPSYTISANHPHAVAVYDARGNGDGAVANTITGDHNGHISNYTALAVTPKAYGISSYMSNSMLSDNPRAGIYEADTSRTLDTNANNPGANQGGIAVVALDCRNHSVSEVSGTLQAKSTGGHSLNYTNPVAVAPQYVVRRLTLTECALLQGFPPDWCDGLETPEPTKDDISFWREVWETHRRIMGESSTPKSRNQIVKWLKNPHSDAAEYKMWGNGVSLPVVVFVLGGIVRFA